MSENKHLTPVVIMYADGRRLDLTHEGALESLTVTDRLNGISEFTFIFDAVALPQSDDIGLGSEVSICLGYKDDVQEVFAGEVTAFGNIFSESGKQQMEVKGCTVLYKLMANAQFRNFENKTTSGVIEAIIETYSLQSEVDDFGIAAPFQSEEDTTDYTYIMAQAATYGKQVYASGNTIYVKDEVSIRSDEIIYEWGKSLVKFNSKHTIKGLISEVEFSGWDSLRDESFAGRATLSDLPVRIGGEHTWRDVYSEGQEIVESALDLSGTDREGAMQLAAGRLLANSYDFCTASGAGEGNYKLRAGMRVTIKMVGEQFEGQYMAQEVVHRIGRAIGYRSEFTLKRNMAP
jgi:phage protein D